MRITHVVVTDAFAGTERYAIEVSGELARRGHDVRVIGGSVDAMRRLLPATVRWHPGSTAPQALWSLACGGRRDVVHGHITKADFVVAISSPLTGGARVSTRHLTARRGWSATAARLARAVRWAMHQELAVSGFVAEAVETRVDQVIVNGVRAVPDIDGRREPVVLVAQRLADEKHTAVALDAWELSGLGERGWRLVVAGDGPLRAEVESRAQQLASAEVVGWVDDLASLLSTASIYLAPAPAEPCGLTILEAMAHGLPVVAASSGGNAETVGREPTAALFAPGDVVGAAEQLRRLADDDEERDAYGLRLRTLQRRELTLEHHVDELEAAYAAALTRARR